MRKRGICLLVAVLMVLQLLPQGLVAFANDPDVVSLNEDIVQNFDGATTESLEENGWHLAYTGGECARRHSILGNRRGLLQRQRLGSGSRPFQN